MSLKVLGGTFRSRSLLAPKGDATRPSLAILRKSLFDSLQGTLEAARVLDLYAGSGAIGFEALSRGAAHVTFVERERAALDCIRKNAETLKVTSQSSIIACDVFEALKKLQKKEQQFDLIYIDPPYEANRRAGLIQEALSLIDHSSLLASEGSLFLEEAAPGTLKPHGLTLSTLRFVDSRTFSRSTLHHFMRSL
jgi:16S rRNA (guanine966-N2)-methyltransferase